MTYSYCYTDSRGTTQTDEGADLTQLAIDLSETIDPADGLVKINDEAGWARAFVRAGEWTLS